MENQDKQSIISAEMEINGTIKSSGSIRVDGKVEGELSSSADVTLGKSGKVKGNLSVNSVSIEGSVEGNITAKDRIEMKSSARVNGDIKSKRLTVEDGVTFVGKSEVNPSGAPMEKPAAQPAAERGDDAKDSDADENRGGMFRKK